MRKCQALGVLMLAIAVAGCRPGEPSTPRVTEDADRAVEMKDRGNQEVRSTSPSLEQSAPQAVPRTAPDEPPPAGQVAEQPLPTESDAQRAEYTESMRLKIDALRARAKELGARAAEATAEASRDVVDKVRREMPVLEKRLDELKEVSGEAWQEMKAEMDEQVERLTQSLNDVIEKEKRNEAPQPSSPNPSDGHDLVKPLEPRATVTPN